MKRIVLLDLAGGLGNQIFLFQAARFVASVYNNTILVNKSNIDKNHSKGTSTIDDFVFPKTVRFFQLTPTLNKGYTLIRNLLRKYNDSNLSFFFILDESYSTWDRDELHNLILGKKPVVMIVCGFWQNLDYWDSDFNFKLKSESKKFLELSNEVKTLCPIVFHYRLGRLNNRWEHGWGALSPIFLSNALVSLSKNDTQLKNVWIFSNDLQEARQLTASINCSPYQFVYIDDSELSPAELLILLSLSKTLICSNSTFSILAARIGNASTVVVPSELSKNGHMCLALPNKWKKVNPVWLD